MEEKHCFQAEFSPDRTVVKESYRVTMIRSAGGIINIVLAILCLGFAVYLILPDPWYMLKYHSWYIAYFFFVVGFLIVRLIVLPGIFARRYLRRLSEVYGDAPQKADFFFDDDLIRCRSGDGGKRETAYDQIRSVHETAHAVVLRRRQNLFEMLNKETVQGGSVEDLLTFLEKKNPKAKVYRKRRTR